ncbi:MAG: hypothetical protein IPM84_09335 [Anaerolineae bacterium]|nr:hypothetical protein [Anaerolineae bacterium]
MIPTEPTVQIGGVNLGNLPDYLFFFADAHTDANWQGATKGFVGDVAVDGVEASERTSGGVPYAGTIFTNDTTLSAWQGIVNQNAGQAFGSTGNIALISQLEGDLNNAFLQINALPATLGYASVSSTSLDGIDTTNGVAQTLVINVTSGFGISSQIDITGDANDAFILRWDTDANFSNGYDGQVKFQSGGAIVPHGGLKPTNFIHVAGDINASGGGSTPSAPYPQGPRLNDGQSALCTGCADFSGGGFFTGYWLTTGSPTNPADATHSVPYGDSSSLSNGIFVGGWYSINTKFSMTSGTSGVYVSPPAAPAIAVKKYVSVDNQATWDDAESAPGPTAIESSSVYFRFEVTNTGDVTLTNVTLSDSDFSPLTGCTVPATLNAGQSYSCVYGPVTAVVGQHENTATVQGSYGGATYSDTDKAHYYGTPVGAIGDFVWYDRDQDGIEYVGEPGIPNVTIQLRRDSNGNNILDPGDEYFADTVTDADGGYFFTDLPSGTYFVDVTDTNNVLAGLTDIVANQSKPDPTAAIALSSGQVYKDADFGYYQAPTSGNAIIGDTVWYDDNGDGIQQPGEPGIPNIQVCATPTGGGAAICDTTDSNGHYLISVPAGSYNVAPTNPPAGYTATTIVPHPVTVQIGQQYLDADFGYNDPPTQPQLGTIGNLVFLDANKDGICNAGDSPLAGVSVDLIRDSNADGIWDAGEPIIATVTSSAGTACTAGNYQFTGLPAGPYLVHVSDTNAVLTDYTKSPLGAAGVDNNNQADPYAVNLPTAGSNLTADFGYYPDDHTNIGVIGNQVWIEYDSNGIFNPLVTDVGQAGVTVELLQNSVVIATTTTGAGGDYAFVSLPAGNYQVRVSDTFKVLKDYVLTVLGPNPGQDNNHQAQPYAVSLAQGGFNLTADFGYTQVRCDWRLRLV